MAQAAIPVAIAATVISATSDIRAAKMAEQIGNRRATEAIAAGTRTANELSKQGMVNLSNARAAMAANGGSTTDAGALRTLSKIEANRQYNTLAAMYEGRTNADMARYEARLQSRQYKTHALSTVLSGASQALILSKPEAPASVNNYYSSTN